MLSTKSIETYVYILIAAVCMCLPSGGSASVRQDPEHVRYEAMTLMESNALFERATGYTETDPDSALLYYDVLAKRYQSSMPRDEARLCARGLFAMAVIFYNHFNYNRAMESLLKCRKICEENDFRDILSDSFRTIGNIYSMHEDFDHAIGFYKEALGASGSIGDRKRSHKALSNLVGANIFINDLQAADAYYAEMAANQVDDPMYRYDILVDGALMEENKGNHEKALRMLSEASSYIDCKGLGAVNKGTVNSWLASIYWSLGRTDSALVYYNANERLARLNGQDDLLAETLRSLHQLHKASGQKDKANRYLEEYLELSDKVFNQKAFNSLKNTQFQWELDKSEHKIKHLDEERLRQRIHIEQQRTVLLIVIASLLVLAFLLLVIYRQKAGISKAYTDLYERNRSMLDKEKHLMLVIRELQEPASHATAESKPEERPAAEDEPMEATAAAASADISQELKHRLLRNIEAAMERPELFCDPDFTLNTLAEEIGSNSTYVSKVINTTFGVNFRTFLNEYRIKESMTRMSDEAGYANYTINAIAESVGFRSQSAFIAAFTKFTGMKPSTYQQIARKKKS